MFLGGVHVHPRRRRRPLSRSDGARSPMRDQSCTTLPSHRKREALICLQEVQHAASIPSIVRKGFKRRRRVRPSSSSSQESSFIRTMKADNKCPIGAFFAHMLLLLLLVLKKGEANHEGEALGAFKQALVDPNGVLGSWDTALVNPCTWFRVTCNNENFVTRLDLENASLSGYIVPQLGSLRHLQYLELNNNFLSGSIPQELEQLSELVSLDLYENSLSGRIPDTLGNLVQLKFLRLNGNFLSGRIPDSLTKLSNLQVIDLSNNHLSGPVPTAGAFSRMSSVSFQGNTDLCGPNTGRRCT